MSRKGQNNHYHYAEQFTDRRCRAKRFAMPLPRRTVFFALLVLLIFGAVTATFSVGNTFNEAQDNGALIVRIRNPKISEEAAEAVLAKDNALASTGASADLAEVSSNPSSASAYYYSGTKTSWASPSSTSRMTNVDNVYCYYSLGTLNANAWQECKVFTSTGWNNTQAARIYQNFSTTANATNHIYAVQLNNLSPDCNNSNDSNTDNMNFALSSQTTNVYLLAFYPSTTVNTNTYAVCCLYQASSTSQLPRFKDQWDLWGVLNSTDDSTWARLAYDIVNTPYSATINSNKDSIVKVYNDYVVTKSGSTSVIQNNSFYGYSGNLTYSTNSRTLTTSGNNLTVKGTALGGTHTFSFNSSSKVLTVTYPKYSISASRNITAAASAPSVSASSVAIGSSVTVTAASANSGYEFVRWDVTGGSVKTDSYGGTATITTSTSNPLTVYPYGSTATVTLRAVYKVAEYRITYADGSGSPVTGTISNPAAPNNVPAYELKEHGATDFHLTDKVFTRTGYTQVGWSTTRNSTSVDYNLGASYTADAAETFYPVWQLDTPHNSDPAHYLAEDPTDPDPYQPKIIGGTIVKGGTFNISPDVVACPDDAAASYSYTITRGGNDATSYASIGTAANNASTFHIFTTNTPGEYDVTWTVTYTNSTTGVTNTDGVASKSSNTVKIYVKPAQPSFTMNIVNCVPADADHDGTQAKPLMIMIGNRYYFTASVTSPISGYTYEWSKTADFAAGDIIASGLNLTSITFNADYVLSTDPSYEQTLADVAESGKSVTLYLRATYNGVSNDSTAVSKHYYIQPLIKSFVLVPVQKIFNTVNEAIALVADYNMDNATGFTTDLYFSADNYHYGNAVLTETDAFISDFTNVIRTYLYSTGPKYFFMVITGENESHETITSPSPKIHTTVGTSDASASRPLYFYNGTNIDLTNYLVMCYYVDGSNRLRYQAAQDLDVGTSEAGVNYRVMIPSDATAVRFGFVSQDEKNIRYYGTPTLTSGTIGNMTAPIFKGCTDQITLTDSTRVIRATTNAGDATFYQLTCTTSAYTP